MPCNMTAITLPRSAMTKDGSTYYGGDVPSGAAPNLFADSFESGSMLTPTASVDNGNFDWGSQAWTYLVDIPSDTILWRSSGASSEVITPNDWEASEGNRALRFNYRANEPMSEQRFTLDAQPELYIKYRLRVPTNFYHGNGNNKFFSIFGSTYDGAGTVTFETRPLTAGACYIYMKDGGAIASDEGDIAFLTAADAGRWMDILIHVKTESADGADDGVIQLSRRFDGEQDYTLLLDKQNAFRQWESGTLGYREGYFMGYANGPYSAQTEWMMDEVKFSTAVMS